MDEIKIRQEEYKRHMLQLAHEKKWCYPPECEFCIKNNTIVDTNFLEQDEDQTPKLG